MAAGIDRELLHVFLWNRRYGDDLVEIHQQQLAESLAVTKHTMSRVVSKMVDEGRLSRAADQIYRVYDPDELVSPG